MSDNRLNYGDLPERDAFIARVSAKCPNYPMTIKDPDEWTMIAQVVNRGIDAHLEIVACEADAGTGRIVIKGTSSLYTFLRRLANEPPMGDHECGDACYNESYAGEVCPASRALGLASAILGTLGYEWV